MTQSAIALTIGDPDGIGPEIAIKAAAKLAREGGPAVVLAGDEFVVRFYADLRPKVLTILSFDGMALLFASVGHGSGFDMTGRGLAEPEAVLRSIRSLSGASHLGDAAVS